MLSLLGEVIARLGICYAFLYGICVCYMLTQHADASLRFFCYSAALPAILGLLSSRREVRLVAATLIVVLICMACIIYARFPDCE